VTVATNGTPIGPTNLRRIISGLAIEAGIEEVVTP
jgi:hypothetical protein